MRVIDVYVDGSYSKSKPNECTSALIILEDDIFRVLSSALLEFLKSYPIINLGMIKPNKGLLFNSSEVLKTIPIVSRLVSDPKPTVLIN